MIGQNHLEEIIRSRLAEYNVHVELGMELVSFEQDEHGVRAQVIHHRPDGDRTETISADWIVSAEGGKSAVVSRSRPSLFCT